MIDVIYITGTLLEALVDKLIAQDNSNVTWGKVKKLRERSETTKALYIPIEHKGITYTVTFYRRDQKGIRDRIFVTKPLTTYEINIRAGKGSELRKKLRRYFNEVLVPYADANEGKDNVQESSS